MSERLKKTFLSGKKLLVSYAMVGYPDFESSLKTFELLIENGSDIIEIGYPFSDPVADGSTIQVAHEKALENGIGFKDVLQAVELLRSKYPEVPLIVMTYYNPIFKIGLEKFVTAFKSAGADGFIVPDLPPEESGELKKLAEENDLSLIMLAAPTSSERRLKLICQTTGEFTYFVSVTGITGERDTLPLENLKRKLQVYRKVCNKKVVVGFGISKKEHAKLIGSLADGIVVGSLFVKLSGRRDFEGLKKAVKELKEGLSMAS
ncbi:MAG: tryptophan synthase subunit alpha [Gammaproteobacteria bacterium]|nr:MAG: tryptophan synthase subunit alpha [Gammaproteobacteria bacterium]